MTTVNITDDGRVDGYLTAMEYAAKNNIGDSMVRRYIQMGIIKSLKIGNINYIKEDLEYPRIPRGRRRNLNG